jgi:hypothetical protein
VKLRVALMVLQAAGALRVHEQAALPPKRVEVDKTLQVLRAYEGDRLVFQTRVSTGRGNSTPGRVAVRV